MHYTDFETRWLKSGGAERANYGLFLQVFCDLLGVPRPDPNTDNPAQDAYVLERAVTFDDGGGKQTTGRIDLYKRGCFVLETKQGTTSPDEQATAEKAQLGQPAEKRRRGHAVRGTAKWEQMMRDAQEQALRYVRALPASEPRPPFVVVVDVGHCFDVYSNFAGVGDSYVPFPDSAHARFHLRDLALPTAVVQGAAVPLTAQQAAARFRGTKAAKVQPLLDTLVSLALLRHVPELDAYAT